MLHDVFGFPYDDVAGVLDRSSTACRALAGVARRGVKAARSGAASPDHHAEAVADFKAAFAIGDVTRLVALMHSDATLLSDGGGEVRAALRPILGADKVARYVVGVRRLTRDKVIDTAEVKRTDGDW